MSEQQLQTVVELQQTLDELRAAEELLAGIPDWMRELHEEYSGRKAEIDALAAVVEEAEQERRQAEIAIVDIRERVKHFQAQIGQVRNQREYGALLQEIDSAKRQIQDLEEQALAAMERGDETRRQLEEERDGFQELDSRYAAELAKWEEQKPGVADNADKLRARIEVLKERLPPQTLSLFERILERYRGAALAEVRRVARVGKGPPIWHCSACNYRVRLQAVVGIQTEGRLELCDSCKRILHLDEAAD